jgi:uncharacterized protein (TIGR00369 family)
MSHTFIDKVMENLRTGAIVSPVEQFMGMRMTEHGRGSACYELPVRMEHANPMGMVQGGVATVLADVAMAMAMATTLTNDETRREAITTVDIFSRFLKPINARKVRLLRAEARVVRTGRNIVWAECDLTADGECAGKFNATGSRVPFEQKDYELKPTTPPASTTATANATEAQPSR